MRGIAVAVPVGGWLAATATATAAEDKQGHKTDAAAAYKTLSTTYRFAQCWDPKGWFWRPAEAAAGRLDQLDFDAVLDAK